ncbi:tyrosine-type recombinase/integrase [Shouchella patagoniensis]|uniref:tyrosine-type recombinase/integrase n=1 Tax=Shouchella patagoniensis TaxID=228576 RepID=UPI0009953817|nr:site-specific integrase [Shouchella patagoniensis]
MIGQKEQDAFFVHLAAIARQPSTIRRYRYDLLDFFTWLDGKPFELLNHQEVERFFYELIETRNYKVRTIRRIASVLRQFTHFLQTNNILNAHPLSVYQPPLLETEPLSRNDWVSKKEIETLLKSSHSETGLSENQLLARPQLTERNFAMFSLFADYGLTLKELCDIEMNAVNFIQHTIQIENETFKRNIHLPEALSTQIHTYWSLIPEPVRPRLHSSDSLFVAYDFKRRTYHWSYEDDAPKALTEIALQKMIRTEVARAGLRKGISAQHFRNSYLLRALLNGEDFETIQKQAGLKSMLSLRRYSLTIDHLNEQDRELILHS